MDLWVSVSTSCWRFIELQRGCWFLSFIRRVPKKLGEDMAIYRVFVFVEAGLGSLKTVVEEFVLVD